MSRVMDQRNGAAPAWLRVCRVSDIPVRGGRRLSVGSTTVALFRLSHDAVVAVHNRCPHRGGPLSEGIVSGHTVTCPLHGRRVDLVTGEMVKPDRGCVRRFSTLVEDGVVYLETGASGRHGELAPIEELTGVHPDNRRPRLGRRRAKAEDFTFQDFDRPIPTLGVEPPSPATVAGLRLVIGDDEQAPDATWSLDALRARLPAVTSSTHLTCLMFGFTRPVVWEGFRLADLLGAQDLGGDWQHLSCYSWDTDDNPEGERFFETLPRRYALDPRTLLAFGMNGEPLPKEHGGPLRLVVPFLQGYKSVKWLTWLRPTRQDHVGYKKRHGFIEFPELRPPDDWRPSWEDDATGSA